MGRKKKYGSRHRQTVIETYKKTGSGVKAAEAAGTSTAWAYRVLKEEGLPVGRTEYSDEMVDRAIHLYVEKEYSCRQVAEIMGVSDQWVYEQVRDQDVLRGKNYTPHPVRYLRYNGRELQLRGRHGPDKVRQILEDYESGLGPSTLSEKYDAPVSTIEKWLAKAGVVRTRKEAAAQHQINQGNPSPVWMARKVEALYVEEEWSTVKIADELDIAVATVVDYLEERNVERRSRSEAMQIRWHGSKREYIHFVQHVGFLYHIKGLPKCKIARQKDVSTPTVTRALESDLNPYEKTEEKASDWWVEDTQKPASTNGLSVHQAPKYRQ